MVQTGNNSLCKIFNFRHLWNMNETCLVANFRNFLFDLPIIIFWNFWNYSTTGPKTAKPFLHFGANQSSKECSLLMLWPFKGSVPKDCDFRQLLAEVSGTHRKSQELAWSHKKSREVTGTHRKSQELISQSERTRVPVTSCDFLWVPVTSREFLWLLVGAHFLLRADFLQHLPASVFRSLCTAFYKACMYICIMC